MENQQQKAFYATTSSFSQDRKVIIPTPQDTEEFKNIYNTHFGKDLTDQQAQEKGIKLLRLMSLVYRPMTRGDFEAVQTRRKKLST